MGILILSYRQNNSVSSMGNVVDHCDSAAFARYVANDEEAVAYVANLNAYNDYDASAFQHYFIYPSCNRPCDCPIGGISIEAVGHLDLRESESIIPSHLRESLERREKALKQIRKEQEAEQRELDKARRREEERQRDVMEYEHLQQKLGLK